MKIFHEENGRNVVYVQVNDILFIVTNLGDMPIPASICCKVFCNDAAAVTCSNHFAFIRFDTDSEISFFKELDFIIDYDDYKNLSKEQLEKDYEKVVADYNNSAKKWSKMSNEEKVKNTELQFFIKKMKHMAYLIEEIYYLKHNPKAWYFPDFVK